MNLKTIVKNIISESNDSTSDNDKKILDVYVVYNEFESRNVNVATKKPIIMKNIFLNIANLTTKDMGVLKTRFKAGVPRKQEPGEVKVFYKIPADKPEAFFISPRFGDMWRYLESTGNYSMPDLDSVKDEIISGNLDEINEAELKKQNQQYVDLFTQVITSLGDPETQKLLQTISKIGFNINEEVYGKVRSPDNVLRTYSVKRDATFVASRGGWRDFNRYVVSGAKPIYLSVPNVSQRDKSKAERQLSITQSQANELGPHVVDSFRIHTTTGISGFHLVSFYDVSDTRVYSHKEDLWTGRAGLVDNLRGILNDFATNELEVDKEELDKLGLKPDDDKNEKFSTVLLRVLEKTPDAVSPAELSNLKKMNPKEDFTVHKLLDGYFRSVFDRGNDNRLKDAKVIASIVAVMTIEDVANPIRLKLLATHEDNVKNLLTDRTSWVGVSLPVTKLIRLIGDNLNENLNESKHVSPEFIMGLFNITPNMLGGEEDGEVSNEDDLEIKENDKEIIKEEFFRVFNKIKNE